MNIKNHELKELCSRKLLDIYQNTRVLTVKTAIEQELVARKHFTNQVSQTAATH